MLSFSQLLIHPSFDAVHEWVGKKEGLRMVNLLFNSTAKMVEISDRNLKLVRTIDLSRGRPFDLWLSSNGLVAVLKLPKEYDLVKYYIPEN